MPEVLNSALIVSDLHDGIVKICCITKVMFDHRLHVLHINPGAAGLYGQQPVRTLVRFVIDGEQVKDLEVIELG